MERTEIFEKLNEIFEDVLDLEQNPQLTETTTSDDVEEWDSLSHIQLVIAIQKAFGIKFSSSEMMSWENVGAIVNSISNKVDSNK